MTQVEDLGTIIEGTTSTDTRIPVYISYEIIRLFSEGLYQSPHKAIEELVSNGYDAGAINVHVLLPREPDDEEPFPPLWVIDDGSGMDATGFGQLWRVADSAKAIADEVENPPPEDKDRAPIGQFGIGKLAAYVLAWRLSHISCVDGVIRSTSMNFRALADRHQYEPQQPFDLQLYELSFDQAKVALAGVEKRDPHAWTLMFGEPGAKTWTAAALSDFKALYDKLQPAVPDVEVVFVGRDALRNGGSYKRWLVHLADELSVSCRFIDEVPRSELPDWYGSARVVVVPSRYDNFPYAGLEAMAARRPVVCTEGTGTAELLRGAAAGNVVPVGDADALAGALLPYLLDAERAARAGLEARSLVERHCTPEQVAQEREASYLEAIDRWRRSRRGIRRGRSSGWA